MGAKEDYLRRVLRLLVALGVFREERPGGCALWWPASKALPSPPQTCKQSTKCAAAKCCRCSISAGSSKCCRSRSAGVFANNAESDLLRRDAPGSAVDTVLHWGDESYLGHSHMYDGMLASHPSIGFHDVSGGLSYWEW